MINQQFRWSHPVLLLVLSVASLEWGFSQTSKSTPSDSVRRTMSTALEHCHGKTADGVQFMTFVPPSNEEVETIMSLGSAAIRPLSAYIDSKETGFTQLFAVKFLTALRNPSALDALEKAFGKDHWEVTRMAALDGMFETSKTAAKPYVEAALTDSSAVVRHLAQNLWSSYAPVKSE